MESREKTIVRTSIIGIVANLFLAGFKAFIGFVSNSIAIMLDAARCGRLSFRISMCGRYMVSI